MPYVGYGGPMQLLAVGHKRTGACPTFERPVLQRDGVLLRVPLVGGALTRDRALAVADVAATVGSDTIELTNRGNLQLRGVREGQVGVALDRLRSVGLGAPGAALVSISPFAGPREHDLRGALLAALDALLANGPTLAPKFAVHIDDAGGWTAGRRAEAVLVAAGDDWAVRVPGIGGGTVPASEAVALVTTLAEACRAVGDQARVADVLAAGIALPSVLSRLGRPQADPVGAVAAPGPLGEVVGPDGHRIVVAAPVLGRLDGAALAAVAHRADGPIRVTPWRSLVLPHRPGLTAELGALGLVVRPDHPAAGVISCVGAAGCWQTEADALAEAHRQIATRRVAARQIDRRSSPAVVHVTGCDKRCATRGPVDVTFVGRPDGRGFDEVRS